MVHLRRGALVEYASEFKGDEYNVVVFQFNPENLTRNIEIPPRQTGSKSHETNQAGESPVEKITLKAHFSASDRLNKDDPTTRKYGVGAQLAALEKMVYPTGKVWGSSTKAVDNTGESVSANGKDSGQSIPREKYPRLLFIWGTTKVHPVIIDSMSITEQHFDNQLNPIQAEVDLGLSVIAVDPYTDDDTALGAYEYTNKVKEDLALANPNTSLEQTIESIDTIRF
jgi:hypothetical protein